MEERAIPRILNNEVVLLVALSVAAFGVFGFTRTMAARQQRMEARIAAIWYEQGEQFIAGGQVEKAIQAFRKATANAADDQQYALALANALAAGNHDSEAEQLLLQLRESDPEDAQINISLARLAAKRGDADRAVHYYQNALYGRWTGDQAQEQQVQLRNELIRLLLQRRQFNLASSELLILEARIPNTAPAHVEVAKMFLEAGDLQHALNNYSEAVQLDSHNVEALTGAGETSFRLGNYPKAVQYLNAAQELAPESQKTSQLLPLAEAVLAEDPLAPHLTAEERRSRLLADFQRSSQRLESCLAQTTDIQAGTELPSLKTEVQAMQPKLTGKQLLDFDTARSAVVLILRIQKAASAHCGQPPVEDQALLLIGHEHNGAQP